jgi:hypothetical protein
MSNSGVLKLARQAARRQGDLRYVACTSKRRYQSERAANRQLKRMKGMRGVSRRDSLIVYCCDWCGCFHIGHNSSS